MRTCETYVRLAKAAFGNQGMSDRELGERLGGIGAAIISNARYGKMSDRLAMLIAQAAHTDPGEVIMVARLEREKDQDVRAALEAWAGNVFSLLPKMVAPELVRDGRRVAAAMRQNR